MRTCLKGVIDLNITDVSHIARRFVMVIGRVDIFINVEGGCSLSRAFLAHQLLAQPFWSAVRSKYSPMWFDWKDDRSLCAGLSSRNFLRTGRIPYAHDDPFEPLLFSKSR